MKKLTLLLLAFFGIFSPIELCIFILMGTMLLDTLVKIVSIKIISVKTNRRFFDLFQSKLLRTGYIVKGLGYFILALAVFPLDYYMLTPFLEDSIAFLGYKVSIPSTAIFTNILLAIFSLIEIASINENWIDITGNDMLKGVFNMVKKIRSGIHSVSDTVNKVKNS